MLFLSSCSKNKSTFFFSNTTFESIAFVEEKNDITFTTTKIPNEYLVKDQSINLKLQEVFIYEFLAPDNSNVLKTQATIDYEKALQHFSQNIAEDFVAINNKGEEIKCSGVIHERTFGVRPQQRLILHFNKTNENPITTINYADRLFDCGLITHQLKETDLEL